MIVRSFLLGVFSAIFLLVGLFPAGTSAQSPINLQVQQTLSGSRQVKYPDIAVAGRTIAVGGTAERRESRSWVKTVDQSTFGDPIDIGNASGKEDYIPTAVSGRSDGTVTYAWIGDDEDGPIRVRQRYPDGTLSGEVTARSSGTFRVYVEVASNNPIGTTNNPGTTVVVWSEGGRFRYVYATGGNITQWFGPGIVADITSLNRPSMAVGPNNQIGIAFGTASGDIYYGLWNGGGFDVEVVANTGNYEADPTMTFLPNGTPVVAWRRVEGGYFYSKRAGPSNWPASQLSRDIVYSTAAIASDEAGNLSFAWSDASDSRTIRFRAAFATPSDVFTGPVQVAEGDLRTNTQIATTITDRTQINIVVERFASDLFAEYFLLTALGAGSMGAQPRVTSPVTANGFPVVRGPSAISVSFADVQGTPTQVRWRWGAPPSDATTDSGGWVTYSNPLPVPIPPAINTSDCGPETLFTQVRNNTTVENAPKQVSVIIDRKVTGSIRAVNPYIGNKLPVFTDTEEGRVFDLGTNGGASDGDPNYTRDPLFYLEVVGGNDCVGLKQVRYGASTTTLGRPFGIVDEIFANVLTLPNPTNLTNGPRPIVVRLNDDLDNVIDYNTTLILDTVKPVLADGASMTITSDPTATILATLNFSGVTVTDAYPNGYWGVWVANSLTVVPNPAASSALIWSPAELKTKGSNPVLKNWSLLAGLNRTAESFTGQQTFFVYVRFLDGAGNPTDRVVSAQITLDEVTDVATRLPMVRR